MTNYSTREYEFTHGRQPRGFGNWAFFFDGDRTNGGAFWFHGQYGAARKAATVEARRRGAEDVEVGT
jgi:hypothetical protein